MRALHDEHAAALLRYTMYLTGGDRQRAEDVVQEVLLRAWQHPEAVSGQPARPWLFTVAKNLVIDGQRARRARPQEVGEAALGQRAAPVKSRTFYALKALKLALEERGLAP
jgi:RNA polymerase sigma-70 factor (ECF subfamily)